MLASIFIIAIQKIGGKVTDISANFGVGELDSIFFMPKAPFTRLQ